MHERGDYEGDAGHADERGRDSTEQMNDASHRSTTVWLQWVVSAGAVAAVIISLWRPPSGIPAPGSQQAYRIGALTALLGDPHATAAVIDERVRGFSRFPP